MPDDAALAERARTCDDCIGWLDVCEAACCNHLSFRRNPLSDIEILSDVVRIRVPITADLKRYYELHDANVDGDVLILPREACEVRPERIWVTLRCSALADDLRCRLHPDGKPEVCTEFTLETVRSGDYRVPSRCLFEYKLGDPAG